MSHSFADQLLKAGLVSTDDINRAEAEKQQRQTRHKARHQSKRKAQSRQRNSGKKDAKAGQGRGQSTDTPRIANAEARKILATTPSKQAKDPGKQAQQKLAEQRRLINLSIAELFKGQTVEAPLGSADQGVKFSYIYAGKVRGIYVTPAQQQRLAAGELALTVIKAQTRLIPVALVEPLKAIDPERFIYTARAGGVGEEGEGKEDSSKDDPYADFAVPDDLIW